MMIEIDFSSDEAIYIQLTNQIIMGIATSRLQEGDTLPSVRQLADTVGINMHTVNKAYSLLRQEGFVTIDRRRGAVISIDVNKRKALEELKQNLMVALAKGCCKSVSREEVHQLIDEIFDEYDEIENDYTKIDDNTFVNFADFILNNLENAEYNIDKIRTSLAIMKDGQAVFTNLEKCYIYRYVFAKGTQSAEKIRLTEKQINKIPEMDIVKIVLRMLEDKKEESPYKNNTLRQDKLLWVAREYQRQGIQYVEMTDTDLAKT